MGYTPRQIDEMTIWELSACIDGYKQSNGGEEKNEAPTAEEFYDMVSRLG